MLQLCCGVVAVHGCPCCAPPKALTVEPERLTRIACSAVLCTPNAQRNSATVDTEELTQFCCAFGTLCCAFLLRICCEIDLKLVFAMAARTGVEPVYQP